MPTCRECDWFGDEDTPRCELTKRFAAHKAPTRACAMAIWMRHAPLMSGEVLEIGCGAWRWPRRQVRKRAEWFGLDPAYTSGGNFTQGTVGNIPFESGRFDWVVAMATIEHWGEKGDSVTQGLSEIHRVLKPGGKLVMTAPFHIHGSDLFMYGLVDHVKKIIEHIKWACLGYKEWRRDYKPLPAFVVPMTFPRRSLLNNRHVRQNLLLEDVYGEDRPSGWLLEIQATK